jgi:hypothetical protein
MNHLNHTDRRRTIYEALMLVTQRKGRTILGSEVAKCLERDSETLRIKRVLIRLFQSYKIPSKEIFKEFGITDTRKKHKGTAFYELTRMSKDLVEIGLTEQIENEILAIFKRNELKVM